MNTSKQLDHALEIVLVTLALLFAAACWFNALTKDQTGKPGRYDPTVIWWIK